jgi:hypothetical protein
MPEMQIDQSSVRMWENRQCIYYYQTESKLELEDVHYLNKHPVKTLDAISWMTGLSIQQGCTN